MNLIDTPGFQILQHFFPLTSPLGPLMPAFIQIWATILLILHFCNLLKFDPVLLFTKLEGILIQNLLGLWKKKKKTLKWSKIIFPPDITFTPRVPPQCLINKYSPISAFQQLQIYSPSSDDSWSVFHILRDLSALITFTGRSSFWVVEWTHSHAQRWLRLDELDLQGWRGLHASAIMVLHMAKLFKP